MGSGERQALTTFKVVKGRCAPPSWIDIQHLLEEEMEGASNNCKPQYKEVQKHVKYTEIHNLGFNTESHQTKPFFRPSSNQIKPKAPVLLFFFSHLEFIVSHSALSQLGWSGPSCCVPHTAPWH